MISAQTASTRREVLTGWEAHENCLVAEDGDAVLHNDGTPGPGSETGLVSAEPHGDTLLSFEVLVEKGAIFVAKIHQRDKLDPKSNSYHFVINGASSYLARHDKIFQSLPVRSGVWNSIGLTCFQGTLCVEVCSSGHNRLAFRVEDDVLGPGYCFVGVKGGTARVRDLMVRTPRLDELPPSQPGRVRGIATPEKRPVSAFTAMPRRNLIYHVWPVRGSMWRWNLDQIKTRIDMFNGRRLIGIVHDDRSEEPRVVQEYLEGHGCEFFVAPNKPCGEVVTFPDMLRRVASTDVNEITFYAHAKGVRHEPAVPEPVRRWSEVSYSAALDDWTAVRGQLEQFALTGSFRMLGRFGSHRNIGDWHYSGTFFWMRHSRVFIKDCFDVPAFYWGVEVWPGKYFTRSETGCLLFDNLRQFAYNERFWPSRASEFARWEAARSIVKTPPDLDQPTAFQGRSCPRLEQRPEEFEWFLERLTAAEPQSILTIGAMHGGVEWHIARRFRELGRAVDITVVELAPIPELLASVADARTRFGQEIRIIQGDSTAADTRAQLRSHYDAVFVDGDHGYRGCRLDFDLALSMTPNIIALHDIVDSDWHVQTRCCVSRLWAELRKSRRSEEMATGAWGGIGIVRP